MNCGCNIKYGGTSPFVSDASIEFCPLHAAAHAMLAKLKDIKEILDDRYDYATDTGESPWNGAGILIYDLETLIAQTESKDAVACDDKWQKIIRQKEEAISHRNERIKQLQDELIKLSGDFADYRRKARQSRI